MVSDMEVGNKSAIGQNESIVKTVKNTENSRSVENEIVKHKKDSKNIMIKFHDIFGLEGTPTISGNGRPILLGVMLLLFLVSVIGLFVMWFTEYYNNTILSNLILARNSETVQQWISPNPKYDTLLKVHIFNYTNLDRYLSGLDEKIKVDDIGPFTYQEHTTKVDVTFNDNFTVTFRDHRSYKFLSEKSSCGQYENVIVPNVPLLSADVKIESLSIFKKLIALSAIRNFREPVFKTITAHEFLWGYPDKIVRLDIGTGDDKFGVLMNRNGTSVDKLQIYTGEDDIRKLKIISQFNGMPSLTHWSDDKCNSINGSDPSIFPPHLIAKRRKVYTFLQVLCRKIPLVFEKEVIIFNNIDALRYRTPLDVFANPRYNPENSCYCQNTDICLPSGIINATKCYNDAPIYPSFPHFFSGDPALYERFDGINPTADKHQTFADIHPRFGFPISGASRIQINLLLNKGTLLKDIAPRIKKGTIFPLLWIEITSGDLTNDIIDKLYVSTFGLNAIQFALKYGTLLICLISFAFTICVFYTLRRRNEEIWENDDNNPAVVLNTSQWNTHPSASNSKP